MRTDSERKFVCLRRPNPARKSRGARLEDNDPTCHGGVSAIRNACKGLNTYDLAGRDIYTTGEPCPMCLYVNDYV